MPDIPDNLLPASFRGVPFRVEGHRISGGRAGPLHEFAGREVPYFEDMGRKARSFQVRAYVIGADYFGPRDALQDALEAPGPGPLVLPWGLRVSAAAVRRFSFSERREQLRVAWFDIEFVEAGENLFPAGTQDRAFAARAAADGAQDFAGADFAEDFSVDGEPAWAFDEALDDVADFLGTLLDAAGRVRAGEAAAWDTITRINGVINQAATLVRFPLELVNQIVDVSRGYGNLIPAGLAALRPLLDLFGWGDDSPASGAGAATSRQRRDANRIATTRLVRRIFVAEAARKLTGGGFASLDDALAARGLVVAAIEAEMDAAGIQGGHDIFVALAGLRTEAVRWAEEESARLPRLKSWTPAATVPAAAIAYRLYGDAARAAEVAARNRVRHPGFVPGGVPLRVLEA